MKRSGLGEIGRGIHSGTVTQRDFAIRCLLHFFRTKPYRGMVTPGGTLLGVVRAGERAIGQGRFGERGHGQRIARRGESSARQLCEGGVRIGRFVMDRIEGHGNRVVRRNYHTSSWNSRYSRISSKSARFEVIGRAPWERTVRATCVGTSSFVEFLQQRQNGVGARPIARCPISALGQHLRNRGDIRFLLRQSLSMEWMGGELSMRREAGERPPR